jgi:hypothetical protein
VPWFPGRMTLILVLTNLFFAVATVAGLAAVCRLGHRLGSGQHDQRLVSLPRREPAVSPEQKAA